MALKVGIIGCGGIARAHWNGWGATGGRAEVVALADISAANRAWFKERAPHAKEFDDFAKMYDEVKLDAVDICLPHNLHLPAILAAVKRNLHWICEKPLCMTLDEAAQIDQAMKSSKLVGMSAHNQVFMPALCEAKRMIDAGYLGELYTIISQDCFIMGLPGPGALPGTPPWTAVGPGSWRADLKQMGGGELIDTGYHPSYRMLFLAGAEPTTVACVTGTYRNKQMRAEDSATVLLQFANGVTGLMRTSWAMEVPAGHHPFHVVGEHGQLYGGDSTLYYRPNRFNEPAKITLPANDQFKDEIFHFVECIEQGKTPIQSYVDGIRVLKVIRKAYDFVEAKMGKV